MKIKITFNVSDDERCALSAYLHRLDKAPRHLVKGHIISTVDAAWDDIFSEAESIAKGDLTDSILKQLDPNGKVSQAIIEQYHEDVWNWIKIANISIWKKHSAIRLTKQFLQWSKDHETQSKQ